MGLGIAGVGKLGKLGTVLDDVGKYGDDVGRIGNKTDELTKLGNEISEFEDIGGEFIKVNENMSENSRKYQEFITGRSSNESYLLNNVKFDGVVNGKLVDAKGDYSNFVGKDGEFYPWFRGADELVDQAERQIRASNGISVEWYVQNEKSYNAISNLLNDEGLDQIKVYLKPN